jgi:hypothetical protein
LASCGGVFAVETSSHWRTLPPIDEVVGETVQTAAISEGAPVSQEAPFSQKKTATPLGQPVDQPLVQVVPAVAEEPAQERVSTPTVNGRQAQSSAATVVVVPLETLGVDIAPPAGKLPTETYNGMDPAGLTRAWPTLGYNWVAPNSAHYPLYFEEINAERYGYTCCACAQPAISAAHFFGSAVTLPYQMGANCPRECIYTLGHYRPGDCNPWRTHYCPISARGAALQAAAVFGVVALP